MTLQVVKDPMRILGICSKSTKCTRPLLIGDMNGLKGGLLDKATKRFYLHAKAGYQVKHDNPLWEQPKGWAFLSQANRRNALDIWM